MHHLLCLVHVSNFVPQNKRHANDKCFLPAEQFQILEDRLFLDNQSQLLNFINQLSRNQFLLSPAL